MIGLHWKILIACCITLAMARWGRAGEIRATLDGPQAFVKVQAVGRVAQELTTSTGETKDVGMYGQTFDGRIEGDRIIVPDLPVPGEYDLLLTTADGAVLQGWNAHVPDSDYVEPWPLEDDDRQALLSKIAGRDFGEFADDLRVLDMQGNVQNAAVLVAHLRVRPFAGGGYKPGEWIWRVDRMQWEDPDEHTWVPYRPRPFYALIRQRLYEKDYNAKSHVFARHLGGIALSSKQSIVDLDRVIVPRLRVGVYAIDSEGKMIEPIVLKGPVVAVPETEQRSQP